jgi:hypothetical protein
MSATIRDEDAKAANAVIFGEPGGAVLQVRIAQAIADEREKHEAEKTALREEVAKLRETVRATIETARRGEAIRREQLDDANRLLREAVAPQDGPSLSWFNWPRWSRRVDAHLAQSAGQGGGQDMGQERPLVRGSGEQTPASNRGVVEGAGVGNGTDRKPEPTAPAPNATDAGKPVGKHFGDTRGTYAAAPDNGMLARVNERLGALDERIDIIEEVTGNKDRDHEARIKALETQPHNQWKPDKPAPQTPEAARGGHVCPHMDPSMCSDPIHADNIAPDDEWGR